MSAELPNFALWSTNRLTGHLDHLEQALATMAGQEHPLKPDLRATLAAIRAEIARRNDEES